MAVSNGYTTVANIKAHKDISSINQTDDVLIEDLIEAASRYIDGRTWRRFYTTTADETRYFTAQNAERCFTDDIITVTTLKTDGDGDRTYEETWTTSDYDLLPLNGTLNGAPFTYIQVTPDGDYTFPRYVKGVQIVGKFGYSATTPPDIEIACRMIVLRLYQSRYGQQVDGPATITGAGVVITPSDLPTEAEKIINQYRRYS